MADSAAALKGKKENFNFVNIFNNSEKASSIPSSEQVSEEHAAHKFLEWLESSDIVTPVESTTISAGGLFPNNRLIVTFTLREAYKNSFVLLRGLLEFSRPKGIAISADTPDRTFQVQISADQVTSITKLPLFSFFVIHNLVIL